MSLLDAPSYSRAQSDARFARQIQAGGARGLVCFSYDDANVSMKACADLAAARGQRNTFFITSDQLGGTGKLTNGQLQGMFAQRHEIAAHSKTHANMTAIGTTTGRALEYDTPKTVVEGLLGAGTVKSWAYPFGGRNATTDIELFGRYDRIFGTGQDISCVVPLADRDGRFLYGRQGWSAANHQTILDLIRQAATQPIVAIIYTHDPGNGSGAFPGDPSLAQVAEAYDLAAQLGVPSVRLDEALPSGEVVRNGSFETGTYGWNYPLGTPSGLVIESVADAADAGLPGTNSLHLGVASALGGNFKMEQVIPARPNVSYNLAWRWRVANLGSGQQVQQDFARLDSAGAQIASTTTVLSAAAAWARGMRTVTTETNTAAIKLSFYLSSTFTGDVYIDHIDTRPTQYGLYG